MSWRKKFRYQVTPSDRQLMAIGLVVAQWSIIENNLTMIAHGIYGDDSVAKAQYDRLQNFRKRFDVVRDLVSRRIVDPHRIALMTHLDNIGSVVQERDRIVHGLWGSDDPASEDPTTNYNSTHSFNWNAGKPIYNWRLTYDGIMRVALKVDHLGFELMNYLARIMDYPRDFLLSDALQKISLKSEPPPA
jgi:hypothetical protein